MNNADGFDAVVVGAGPNGLVAAVALATQGRRVLLVEAAERVGGALRSEELTLPGFRHDVGATVLPLALASQAFRTLRPGAGRRRMGASAGACGPSARRRRRRPRRPRRRSDGPRLWPRRSCLAGAHRRHGPGGRAAGRHIAVAAGSAARPAPAAALRRRLASCPLPSWRAWLSALMLREPRSPVWPRIPCSASVSPSRPGTACCLRRWLIRSAGRSCAAARRSSPTSWPRGFPARRRDTDRASRR